MSSQETPSIFRPAPPADEKPEKKKGRPPKNAEIKPASTRKKSARKPRPVSVPIDILPALAGMSEADASVLMSILGDLQGVSKRSRVKIVAALFEVFK
jgi:hypothetical protein